MAQVQIKDLNHTHEGILRWLVANPDRPLRECAAVMGVTQAWLSVIINSDLFRARLDELQREYTFSLTQTLEEKLTTATNIALDRLITELEHSSNEEFVLSAADKLLKSKGFGAKASAAPVQVNNYNIQGVDASFLNAQRDMLTKAASEGVIAEAESTDITDAEVVAETFEAESTTETVGKNEARVEISAEEPAAPIFTGKLTFEDFV